MKRFVVLIGPPGAGKGTQAEVLAQTLGLPHVSSGDLFRDHLSRETELGHLARSYMDRGDLVPDDVTVRMVVDRIGQPDCGAGVILDGFPRTLAQGAALDSELSRRGEQVTVVPLIQVQDDVIVERLTTRRVCRDCGAVYNLMFNQPHTEGECEACGGDLYQRDDDNAQTVRNRLYTYYRETAPLIGYYRAKGLLVEINGQQPIDGVQAELRAALEGAGG
ncbi:MAG: adenylate kinase [Anaerolineae bacterium]|nr:adenylate kinase [Anaerolineae bacterium]